MLNLELGARHEGQGQNVLPQSAERNFVGCGIFTFIHKFHFMHKIKLNTLRNTLDWSSQVLGSDMKKAPFGAFLNSTVKPKFVSALEALQPLGDPSLHTGQSSIEVRSICTTRHGHVGLAAALAAHLLGHKVDQLTSFHFANGV